MSKIFNSISYVFTDKNKLSRYLYGTLSNPTDLKVQKALYLTYAFYGATLGQLHSNHTVNGAPEGVYPRYLFPANFVAGAYGPIETDLFKSTDVDRMNATEKLELSYDIPEHRQISLVLNDLIYELDGIDDFSLATRTRNDNVWRNHYKKGSQIPLSTELIIDEYSNRYI